MTGQALRGCRTRAIQPRVAVAGPDAAPVALRAFTPDKGRMSEPLFFQRPNGLTVQEISALTGAVARPGVAPDRRISGIAALDRAGPADLAFLQNPRYAGPFTAPRGPASASRPSASPRQAPAGVAILVTPAPYRAFVAVAEKLYPGAMRPSSLFEASRRVDECARASDGAAGDRRHDRSGRGDRPARGNRRRHRDRGRAP